jgi:hypothetical protein
MHHLQDGEREIVFELPFYAAKVNKKRTTIDSSLRHLALLQCEFLATHKNAYAQAARGPSLALFAQRCDGKLLRIGGFLWSTNGFDRNCSFGVYFWHGKHTSVCMWMWLARPSAIPALEFFAYHNA